jgi:hypothetical protein
MATFADPKVPPCLAEDVNALGEDVCKGSDRGDSHSGNAAAECSCDCSR